MSPFLRLSLLTATIILGATAAVNERDIGDDDSSRSSSGSAAVGIESGFRTIYNNYKQCEGDANMLSCLKLKALKLVDRALSVNNIPISEGISLAKREDNQRSLNEHWTTVSNAIDETALPEEAKERNEKLDELLWNRIKQFVESRSLQLKVNKLLFGDGDGDADDYTDNANDVEQSAKLENGKATRDALTARGKKDKNKGMYMYMMMMKGGMMALAYKGLALLAGKALLVSKIALTLALLVAIKKLFSGGHHSQKTTYEIVKTPIITHSHQYSGGNAQNAHYGNDFTAYDGGPYARSLDEAHSMASQQRQRITLKAVDIADADADVDSRYTTPRIASSAHARSLTHSDDFVPSTTEHVGQFNVPYAHLAAYRKQLVENTPHQRDAHANSNSNVASTTTSSSLKSVPAIN